MRLLQVHLSDLFSESALLRCSLLKARLSDSLFYRRDSQICLSEGAPSRCALLRTRSQIRLSEGAPLRFAFLKAHLRFAFLRARLASSQFGGRASQIRNLSKSLDRLGIDSQSLSKPFSKTLSKSLSLHTGLSSASLCSACSVHRKIATTVVYIYIYWESVGVHAQLTSEDARY